MLNSLVNLLLLKNVNTHLPSYTVTACFFGFIIINFKLLFSGSQLYTIKMSNFSGSEYAECLAALSLLYVGNKHINNKKE